MVASNEGIMIFHSIEYQTINPSPWRGILSFEIFVLECDQLVPIGDDQAVHVVVIFPGIVGHATEPICRPLRVKVVVVRRPAEKAMQAARNCKYGQP